MKVGFSFGRCIRDIVEGKVNIEDVMCIIARTHITHEDQIPEIIDAYSDRASYLLGLDIAKCIDVGQEIYRRGLLHQPRRVGAYAPAISESFVWMDLTPTKDSDNPMVLEAWRNYLMCLKLTSDEKLPADPGINIASYNYGYKARDRDLYEDMEPINLDGEDKII